MYRGLIVKQSNQQPMRATKAVRYGIPNKVHHKIIMGGSGLHGLNIEEYVSMSNIAIGGAIATLAIMNPMMGLSTAIAWAVSGGPQKKTEEK